MWSRLPSTFVCRQPFYADITSLQAAKPRYSINYTLHWWQVGGVSFTVAQRKPEPEMNENNHVCLLISVCRVCGVNKKIITDRCHMPWNDRAIYLGSFNKSMQFFLSVALTFSIKSVVGDHRFSDVFLLIFFFVVLPSSLGCLQFYFLFWKCISTRRSHAAMEFAKTSFCFPEG